MSHLLVSGLAKTVGDKTLFSAVDFSIASGERAGLIGVNGTGKSTFLSILAGAEEADAGAFDHPKNFRIVHVEQEPVLDPAETVLEAMFSGDAPVVRLNREYEDALERLSANPGNSDLQNRLLALQEEMDATGGWDRNALAKTALAKLGVHNIHDRAGALSGGQQKRVALARALIEPCDLLLLDEPTNHLDAQSIGWLQESISRMSCAVIFVTHDRYFLDSVATHIYELADRTLYTHTGNYGDYLEARAEREEQEAQAQQKLRSRFRAELKWVRRGAKARSTKQKARLDRFDQLADQIDRSAEDEALDMRLASTRLGKKVIEGIGLAKSFGDRPVVKPFSFLLQSGDRIGIIGPNGAGKSTLLKLLAGVLPPDAGALAMGSTVRIAYFTQSLPPMDESMRTIDYVRETSNAIEMQGGEKLSATQMLERFLFDSSAHGTPIGKLSGGERKRLYLLKLLMEQPNILLLDEPTNDLDIETLGVLEDFIEQFPGVVIAVSHDRFFLDRIARTLWVLDGRGGVESWIGTYTDYLALSAKAEQPQTPRAEAAPRPSSKPAVRKLTYAEKKEWESIGDRIEEAERRIEVLESDMAQAGSDFTKLQALQEGLAEENRAYEALIARWSELEEIAEP